jgi:hypothetical protein
MYMLYKGELTQKTGPDLLPLVARRHAPPRRSIGTILNEENRGFQTGTSHYHLPCSRRGSFLAGELLAQRHERRVLAASASREDRGGASNP